jgi:hypothetical protein
MAGGRAIPGGVRERTSGMRAAMMAPMRTASRSRSSLVGLLAAATLVATATLCSGRACAEEAPAASASVEPSSRLTQEWFGLELTPLSVALTGTPCCRLGASLSPVQAGPGATLRLLRHRWEHAYIIPIEAGFYVGQTGSGTSFLHVQTEGGLVVPGTDRRLEVGLGVGVGMLGMTYATDCDGTCTVGGAGALASLVARYLFVDGPHFTAGASVRAVLPLNRTRGEYLGHITGWGGMLLASAEVGFGR